MVRHKTTITTDLLNQVEELSSQGFNNVMISQSLNIGRQTLSTNKDLKDSIQRGRLTLSKQVTQTVLNTLEANPTNMQMLVKRLCLFSPPIDIKKPTSSADALANLAAATKQYSDGLINESQLRTIEAVSNSYIKAKDMTDVEQRLAEIEKVLHDKK
jgi:Holliday junction resolvasome RuvABC endonuclease subunit